MVFKPYTFHNVYASAYVNLIYRAPNITTAITYRNLPANGKAISSPDRQGLAVIRPGSTIVVKQVHHSEDGWTWVECSFGWMQAITPDGKYLIDPTNTTSPYEPTDLDKLKEQVDGIKKSIAVDEKKVSTELDKINSTLDVTLLAIAELYEIILGGGML